MILPLAISRDTVADYVEALFIVYFILIFIRILLTWVPRMPYNPTLRTVVGFIEEVTDPYLSLFRRVSAAIAAWRRALAVCGAVVLADQATKAIIVSSLSVDHSEDLVLGFKLANTPNEGLAFGIGSGHGLVLAVTIGALALVLVWFALDPRRPGLWLAVGLLAGGALGNLADRVRDGAVTDFIDPPLWPTFNLADVAITFGALALVVASLGAERDGHRH